MTVSKGKNADFSSAFFIRLFNSAIRKAVFRALYRATHREKEIPDGEGTRRRQFFPFSKRRSCPPALRPPRDRASQILPSASPRPKSSKAVQTHPSGVSSKPYPAKKTARPSRAAEPAPKRRGQWPPFVFLRPKERPDVYPRTPKAPSFREFPRFSRVCPRHTRDFALPVRLGRSRAS